MTEQLITRTTRTPRLGVAEDLATYRVRTPDRSSGARAGQHAGTGAAAELRDLVQRRASALIELEQH